MQRGHRAISLRVGFTLIELAMVLVIASLAVGFGIQATQSNSSRNCYAQTQAQLNDINKALIRFVTTNDRFPVPAGSNYGVASQYYGQELATTDTSHMVHANNQYYGAVPFQALGLPNTYAADCWGNKFTYVVSDTLVTGGTGALGFTAPTNASNPETPNGFNDPNHKGTLVVKSGAGGALADSSAAYAVISHGADGSGAFARNFTGSLTNCNNSTSTHIDIANCKTNGVVYTAPFNNGSVAAQFFDDLVIYGDKPPIVPCKGNELLTWGAGCQVRTPYPHTQSPTDVFDTATGPRLGNLQSPAYPTVYNINPIYSTNIVVAPYTVATGTSTATIVCNNGKAIAQGICMKNCDAQPNTTWTWTNPDGTVNTCTGDVPALQDRDIRAVYNKTDGYSTATNTTDAPYGAGTGSSTASFTCTNGTLSMSPNPTCYKDCPASAPVTWTQGSNNCSATVPNAAQDGATYTGGLANTAANFTGNLTAATCSNGKWINTSGTCTPVCNGTVTWGPGNACSATVSNLPNGSSTPVSYTGTGYSGSATAVCTNGSTPSISPTAPSSCNADTSQTSFHSTTIVTPPISVTSGTTTTTVCPVVQTAYAYGDSSVIESSPGSGVWRFGSNGNFTGACATYDRYYYVNIPDITNIAQAKLLSVYFDDFAQITVNGVQVFNGPFSGDTLQVVNNTNYSQCYVGYSYDDSGNRLPCTEGNDFGAGCHYSCSSGTPDINQGSSGMPPNGSGNWVQYLSRNQNQPYPFTSHYYDLNSYGGCELGTNWVALPGATYYYSGNNGTVPISNPNILPYLHTGVNVIFARNIVSGDGQNYFNVALNTVSACTEVGSCTTNLGFGAATVPNGTTAQFLYNAGCGGYDGTTVSTAGSVSRFYTKQCINGTLTQIADNSYSPASTSPGGYPLTHAGTLNHGICTNYTGTSSPAGAFCSIADYTTAQHNYGGWDGGYNGAPGGYDCPVPYLSDGVTPIH